MENFVLDEDGQAGFAGNQPSLHLLDGDKNGVAENARKLSDAFVTMLSAGM